MNTKAVYVVTSSSNDIYIEQALLSIYSLKIYNNSMDVYLLVDQSTADSLIGNRAKIKELSTIIVVDTPSSYTPVQKSRFIKTSFRKYVSGPLLFLDTDMIITASLTELDNIKDDISCVTDFHTPFQDWIFYNLHVTKLKRDYGVDVSDCKLYFNSGLMLVQDTPLAHKFFETWHEQWIKYSQKGFYRDQNVLMITDQQYGYVIKELSGIYNCQILTSLKYFYDAKIIHFYNVPWFNKEKYSPFFSKELYNEIKKNGITNRIHQLIINCKSSFNSHTIMVGKEELNFLSNLEAQYLQEIIKTNGVFYKLIKKMFWFWNILNKKGVRL